MDRGRWKKLIKIGWYDQDGGWVNVSSGTSSPGYFRTKGRKMVVVVLCFCLFVDYEKAFGVFSGSNSYLSVIFEAYVI